MFKIGLLLNFKIKRRLNKILIKSPLARPKHTHIIVEIKKKKKSFLKCLNQKYAILTSIILREHEKNIQAAITVKGIN